MTTSTSNEKSEHGMKRWIRRFARIGYLSKGVVYILIGMLALLAAFGLGGKVTGTTGMLRSIADIPLGELLLWLIATGLIGYILWDFIRVVTEPKEIGSSFADIARRILYAITGLLYANVSFQAFRLIWQARKGIYKQSSATESFIQQTFGQWITILIGIVIVGFGVYEIYKGLRLKFMKKFKTEEMNEHAQKMARNSGRIGLVARGAVFGMIGYFFIRTAVIAGKGNPVGLDRALSELAQLAHGPWMIGIVAAGLILYGISEIIKGRYKYMSMKK